MDCTSAITTVSKPLGTATLYLHPTSDVNTMTHLECLLFDDDSTTFRIVERKKWDLAKNGVTIDESLQLHSCNVAEELYSWYIILRTRYRLVNFVTDNSYDWALITRLIERDILHDKWPFRADCLTSTFLAFEKMVGSDEAFKVVDRFPDKMDVPAFQSYIWWDVQRELENIRKALGH